MIEMFTDRNPMRLDEFKLPADGFKSSYRSEQETQPKELFLENRPCPSSLHDEDGGAHDADRPD